MEKLLKNIGFVLLFFLVISMIMILYSGPAEKPATVSLSELVTQINDGQVKTSAIKGDDLSIELNEGKKEKSIKEHHSSLTE